MTDILVHNVNVKLLRKQRDMLVRIIAEGVVSSKKERRLDGVVNLIDEMLDIADGVNVEYLKPISK